MLTPDETGFGFQSHPRFCRESLTVETEGRDLVPMVLLPGQVRLEEAIQKQRRAGRPVRIIYLKSRRIAATTGTAARFFHDTAFSAGVHTVVLAHDDTSVQNIFSIYERFYQKYKPFQIGDLVYMEREDGGGRAFDDFRPPKARALSDRIYFEFNGDPESSFIQIHTAGNCNFGRSFRIDNVHFSEYPYYADPAATRAAVMSAVAKLASTTAVVEGTAKTIGDDFHKMWQQAVNGESESEWLPLFMGWWEHPNNRMPLAVPLEQFGNSLTVEERDLMGRFNLDLKQLAWRRWTIVNDFTGDMQSFRREHPATPEEAFTAASRNRFSIPHIQKMPVMRNPVAGELEWNEIGAGERRLAFLPGQYGAMRVFRRPEKGRLYALGFDCAQGLDVNEGKGDADPDYSVGQMLDRDTGEQCAVLRARMMPGETGRYMTRFARWYNFAQVCGERNPGGGGVSALEAMLTADYPSGLIYHRPVTPDRDPQVRGDRIGWDTSQISRPILISLLDEAIRQLSIAVHCEVTIQELLTFVLNPLGKAVAQRGCHDDCVIALALALIVITRMPRPLPPEGAGPRPEVRKYGQPRGEPDRGRIVRSR